MSETSSAEAVSVTQNGGSAAAPHDGGSEPPLKHSKEQHAGTSELEATGAATDAASAPSHDASRNGGEDGAGDIRHSGETASKSHVELKLPPHDERETVKALQLRDKMKEGDRWYLVSAKWWNLWCYYVEYSEESGNKPAPAGRPRPGPIDNSSLLAPNGDLALERLQENRDFVLVPRSVWRRLKVWYNTESGQNSIWRPVVAVGVARRDLRVELRPIKLTLYHLDRQSVVNPAAAEEKEYSLSGDCLARDLRHLVGSQLFSAPHSVRLSICRDNETFQLLSDTQSMADVAQSLQPQREKLCFELALSDGKWPRDLPPESTRSVGSYPSGGEYSQLDSGGGTGGSSGGSTYTSGSYPSTSNWTSRIGSWWSSGHSHTSGSPVAVGMVGLSNLGNTCFMNSALQCLVHAIPLTDYFLSSRYQSDVNRDNPLGMKGELADAYKELLDFIWTGQYSCVSPTRFKSVIGKFAPQFSGYQQQDSQELLAFLLDGLHEDLNRVTKKPYVETVESEGREDAVVAAEAWEKHLMRNRSVIVDCFQGQFKSTVVCPTCSKVSITFDPFMYLSVPLPVRNDRIINITLVYAEPTRKAMRFSVTVSKRGPYSALRDRLAEMSGLGTNELLLVEVYDGYIWKDLVDDGYLSGIDQIRDNDVIMAYQKVLPSSAPHPDTPPVHASSAHDNSTATSSTPAAAAAAAAASEHPTSTASATVTTHTVAGSLTTVVTTTTTDADMTIVTLSAPQGPLQRSPSPPPPSSAAAAPPLPPPPPPPQYIRVVHRGPNNRLLAVPFLLSYPAGDATVGAVRRRVIDETLLRLTEAAGTALSSDPHSPQSFVVRYGDRRGQCTSTAHEYDAVQCVSCQFPPDDAAPLQMPLGCETVACCWSSTAFQQWFDPQFADKKVELHESVQKLVEDTHSGIDLADCFETFARSEKLSKEDAWYCSNCREHREATKKFDIWRLPDLLVVHLKRFQYSRSFRDKLETLVRFPLEALSLARWCVHPEQSPLYDLQAVSNHSGGLGGGHYTAAALGPDNEWYRCNDSMVSQMSRQHIVTDEAYLLFYKRRGCSGVIPPCLVAKSEPAPVSSEGAASAAGASESATPDAKPGSTLTASEEARPGLAQSTESQPGLRSSGSSGSSSHRTDSSQHSTQPSSGAPSLGVSGEHIQPPSGGAAHPTGGGGGDHSAVSRPE